MHCIKTPNAWPNCKAQVGRRTNSLQWIVLNKDVRLGSHGLQRKNARTHKIKFTSTDIWTFDQTISEGKTQRWMTRKCTDALQRSNEKTMPAGTQRQWDFYIRLINALENWQLDRATAEGSQCRCVHSSDLRHRQMIRINPIWAKPDRPCHRTVRQHQMWRYTSEKPWSKYDFFSNIRPQLNCLHLQSTGARVRARSTRRVTIRMFISGEKNKSAAVIFSTLVSHQIRCYRRTLSYQIWSTQFITDGSDEKTACAIRIMPI